jgi:hypothetical protein
MDAPPLAANGSWIGAAAGWLIGALLCIVFAGSLSAYSIRRQTELRHHVPASVARLLAPAASPRAYRVVGAVIAAESGLALVILFLV